MKHKFTKLEKKILFLSSLGGMLEFYDFIIYGVFAAYFSHQFFPAHDTLMSIIETYVVFVLGYLARPFGGIIFSHIGDEHGRKEVLVITVILMGLSSLGIGLLPTYDSIGVAAPILLLILRLIQGIAIGGELPSTYVYIRESIPHKIKLSFGIVMSGIILGLLLGMLINFIITHTLNQDQISNFGWRIPFFIGGALCLISYKIRKQLSETASFNTIQGKAKFPIIDVVKNYLPSLIVTTLATGALAISIVILIIFMPTYLTKIIGISKSLASFGTLLITIITVLITLILGYIFEIKKYKLEKLLFVWLIISILLSLIAFTLLKAKLHFILIMTIFGIITGGFTILVPAYITLFFPTKVRLTGVALSYNLGFSLLGGLSPIVVTSIIKSGYDKFTTPSICMNAVYILCLLAIIFFKPKTEI